MKKISILLMICCLFACNSLTEEPSQEQYNWEGLRDTLGISLEMEFIKECSPYYTDNNPYNLDSASRLKTMCFKIYYNEYAEYDENSDQYIGRWDTAVYVVTRNNSLIFWGKSTPNYPIADLITWTINNREKL